MFSNFFSKIKIKKNIPQRQIIKQKTQVNKYFDPESELYRYSKFNYYIDKQDNLYEFIEGFHTIPVSEEVSFDEASSLSISFKTDIKSYNKKLIKHQSLINPQKETHGSTYKYLYEDGSLLTTLSSCKNKK